MEKWQQLGIGFALGATSMAALSYLLYSGRGDAHAGIIKDIIHKFDEPGARKILVCGSGMMVPGLVKYLMRHPKNRITIASNIIKDAEAIAKAHPGKCVAVPLDVQDKDSVVELVRAHDIVISYIPPFLHQYVMAACLEAERNLLTASYISPEMLKFDAEAKQKGLLFLNECGLDPGIDIMSTMKVKDEVEREGGKIKKYESWCGGLPSAEYSDNPLSYKFSWDPKAVFNTSKNSAKFLKNGAIVEIKPEDLLTSGTEAKYFVKSLNLEGYPNRDSLVFMDSFGFKDCDSFVRGTLRYGRFGIVMLSLHQIGFTDNQTQIDKTQIKSVRDLAEFLVKDIPASAINYDEVFEKMGITEDADKTLLSKLLSKITDTTNIIDIISSWKFFDLLNSEKQIDENAKTPMDVLSTISLEKMSYKDGERDLVVMKHIFEIETAEGHKKTLHSTLVATGDKFGGDGLSIMAKTVGYTSAIAANLMLDGKISATGVVGPKSEEIYAPILKELEGEGIEVIEEYK